MAPKIIHVTSAHPDTDMRIFGKMAASQARAGWDVAGVVLDNDAAETRTETRSGVEMHLLGGGNYRSRPKRASLGALRVTWHAARMRPDIVQGHDPELIPFLVMLRLFGIRPVYDAHEDLIGQNRHKSWARGWKGHLIQVYARFLVWLACTFCWRVIAATEGVAKAYPPAKTLVVRNYPIAGELGEVSPDTIVQRPARLAYIGGISVPRGIREMVAAVAVCPSLERLELAGKFESPALEVEIRAMPGWDKVDFHGYLDRDGLRALLGRVRGGIVALHPTPNHLHSIPVKMMEYFSIGLPVIASDFTYWHELAGDGHAAIFVDPLSVEDLAGAMGRLLTDDTTRQMVGAVAQGPMQRFVWDAEAVRMNNWLLAGLGVQA